MGTWPQHYKPIQRIKYTTTDEMIAIMKPLAENGMPLIIEGTNIVNHENWADVGYIQGMLKESKVLVKKSPNQKFRYFDLTKNIGKYDFKAPIVDSQRTMGDFMREADDILKEGRPERMYLQETLSGHSEMAQEFAS